MDNYVPKQGERVKAFHPGMMGVVKEGEVVSRGSKYAVINFGELLGGERNVAHVHIVGPAEEPYPDQFGADRVNEEGPGNGV